MPVPQLGIYGPQRDQHGAPQRGPCQRGGRPYSTHGRCDYGGHGAPPKGWLGAGLQETWQTLDHLADCGIDYVADWCNDDQPYLMRLATGRRMACVPYSFETNDKSGYEVQHLTADEFAALVQRQFDVLYREGATQARVLAIALHPYISGVPHRIEALERIFGHICGHDDVWLATGSELAAVARDL